MVTPARRRGMKGLIRRVRAGAYVDGRALTTYGLMGFNNNVYLVCTWCHEPVDEPRRRYWHSHCAVWNQAAKATLGPWAAHVGRLAPYDVGGPEWVEYHKGHDVFHRCVTCGATEDRPEGWQFGDPVAKLEIEHELAISVAVKLGPAGVMRAFMPDNLRWLCHSCHSDKTQRDRVILKILTDGIRPPRPPAPPKPLPMFPEL